MKKRIISVIITFQAALFSLLAGIILLAVKPVGAYASSLGAEEISNAPPANLSELQSASGEQLDYWAGNLNKFDGREYDYLTPARNQYTKNTCWAFAAVGAAEASILREGINKNATKDNLDFDETIAAYTRHVRDGDQDPLLLTTNDKYDFGHWNQGDSAVNALAIMTQGYTLLRENSFHQSVEVSKIKSCLHQSEYYLQSYQCIPTEKDAIKRAILQYGAVTFNYSAPSSNKYYSPYQSANHSSIIVGWNDDVKSSEFSPSKPKGDGAWIIKNSWGDFSGYKGYYYISYELPIGSIYAVDLAMRDDYQNIYYYDGNITVNRVRNASESQAAIYEAKLSSPTKQEQLKAVMISVPEGDLNVNVRIYKNLNANPGNVNDKINKPDQGVPAGEVDAHIKYDGMHTIDLKEPIDLEQGEYFSIVVSCRNKYNSPISVNCAADSSASVNDMTYYLQDGEWISFKSSNYYADSSTGNRTAKIRAITNTVGRKTQSDNDLKYARVEILNRLVYYARGKNLTPDLQVYLDGKLLEFGQDYEVSVRDIVKPGMTEIEISGIGAYKGVRKTYFEVAKPKDPPNVMGGTVDVYDNTINLHDIPIPVDWEWVDMDRKLDVGTSVFPVSIKYVGADKDFYQNSTCDFYVNKIAQSPPADFDIADAAVEIVGEYTYTGEPVEPQVRVIYDGKVLHASIDYILTLQDNTNAGTATVTVEGCGRYFNRISREFEIQRAESPKDKPNSIIKISAKITNLNQIFLNCENWAWETADLDITSDNFPVTAVYIGQDKDNYANIRAQITIIRESQFEISDIAELGLEEDSFTYDGRAKTPEVIAKDGGVVLVQGEDYDVEYLNNTLAGQASVVVKGKNDYSGEVTLYFTIAKAERPEQLPNDSITVARNIKTLQEIQLISGWEWELPETEINAESIKAYAVYSDAANYEPCRVEVTITKEPPKNASKISVTLDMESFVYDGREKTPNVIAKDGGVALVQGEDYDVSYRDNLFAGQAAAVVTFKNDYAGEVTLPFAIDRAARRDFAVEQSGWTYGEENTPEPTIIGAMETAEVTYTYSDEKDGEYAAEKPIDAGIYWIKAEIGQSGNYNSAVAKSSFTIDKAEKPAQLPSAKITVARNIKTLREVQLISGWEWETPETEINAETVAAYAVYADAKNYKLGRVEVTITKEQPKSASGLNIALSSNAFVYDGQEKTPKVIVRDGGITLAKGVDYDVEYRNNKFVGEGIAVVTFKNGYAGTREFAFSILQAEKPNIDSEITLGEKPEKLSDIRLPQGFVWADDEEVAGSRLTKKAIYVGEDANCYKVTEVYFDIVIGGQNMPDKPEQSNALLLAIIIPTCALIAAGAGLAVFLRLRKKRRK